MRLVKWRTVGIYLLICMITFVFYVMLIILNREMILDLLYELLGKRLNVYSKGFTFFTIMPFLLLSGVIVSLLTHYLGKIEHIHFSETGIEIKTNSRYFINKSEINKVIFAEKENKVVEIDLKCKKDTYSIYNADDEFVARTKKYFQIEKEDESTFDYKSKITKKIYRIGENDK
ncbi:hypothetical protein SAMN04488522_101698 [Pedobacter caeni]|uniref:Uncharacterized protein n=2 Tax=Pedobacter caeni TaxID=288992 RepID=A0A1M4UWB7_9SPHI|nr:hypothetical protein SAMN04488522_101698 [Pedobacter caeni]